MIVNNLMSIIWCCSVLLGVSTLKIKNPKALKIINYSVLILLILLMSCNNNCYDEMNIAYSYRTGDFSKEVVLFNVLLSIGRNLGLSFGVFNFITIGVALLLIVSSLKEFTAYWGFLLGGYSFASALLDTSLYRQFIASSVIILGFKYLIGNNKSIKKYVLAVLIAALIHTSFIIYLVFVIVLLHRQPACKVCTDVRQSCWASFLPVLQTADPPDSGIPRHPPAPAWCSAFPAG